MHSGGFLPPALASAPRQGPAGTGAPGWGWRQRTPKQQAGGGAGSAGGGAPPWEPVTAGRDVTGRTRFPPPSRSPQPVYSGSPTPPALPSDARVWPARVQRADRLGTARGGPLPSALEEPGLGP